MSMSTTWINNNQRKPTSQKTTTEVRQVLHQVAQSRLRITMLSTGTFEAVVRDVVAPNGLKEVLDPNMVRFERA